MRSSLLVVSGSGDTLSTGGQQRILQVLQFTSAADVVLVY